MPNVRWLLALITALHRWIYRATSGVIGHRIPILDWRSLLLTHTGRKSGRLYTIPLLYVPDGERFVVVGSNAGDAKPPEWWLNLQARPEARVQAGALELAVRARLAAGEERARLWAALVANYRDYARYERKTRGSRELPVVVVEPRA
ncbi:MAG: nitroreductase family deazaflavin-dependent oxidoreductase [Deltaproteobacteria bacterium]|nr:nitroreductase family deazaflavin-dependent oxidoreductase [Deltaproteobacteria bacterium]